MLGNGAGRFGALLMVLASIASASELNSSRDKLLGLVQQPIPAVGQWLRDPETGLRLQRLTDARQLEGSDDALIVYSRYSPESSDGKYVLVFGSNSTSSWVIERETQRVVRALRKSSGHSIGEDHEVRWDYSGKFPHRIYFRDQMALYAIDDVNQGEVRLIKDFSALLPNSDRLYNDVEGDSSNDSDHWAFMATHYDGAHYRVDAFVHYQISTNQTHLLRNRDLQGSALNHYAKETVLPRPNMVEVSPLGNGIVLHFGRAWGDQKYGERANDIDSWFDGPHLWPLDFNFQKQAPRKIAIDETHSGWAFDQQGKELFISQNNRSDWLDAVAITGDSSGYANKQQIARHGDFGWSVGFHFGKMSARTPGWVFVSTYANPKEKTFVDDWGTDQLLMVKLDSFSYRPSIWRIGHNNNRYQGDYRDEAPAALNTIGNRIYVSNNWHGKLNHREVFVYELPDNWPSQLK